MIDLLAADLLVGHICVGADDALLLVGQLGDAGQLRVRVERKSNNETVWWAGEISTWGKGLKNIGQCLM